MDREKIEKMTELLRNSKGTVVVTGAGISTEAGIPDFRGENGIYRKLGEDRVMHILNIRFFKENPRSFYEFYRRYFIFPTVKPGRAHYLLAELERKGYIKAVVTQNIDNLHQRAGSKKVIPVHGRADRYVCSRAGCYGVYDTSYVETSPGVVPTCSRCGSILKPDVVLFGEPIQNHRYARETILGADLLLVIGSSLTVYPLAGFVAEFGELKRSLVIINKGGTGMDHAATIKLDTDQTASVLQVVKDELG